MRVCEKGTKRQEEKCPSYNAISHTQIAIQVPIVLIFSSMAFSLGKTLNQRKAHKRQCDSLRHFLVRLWTCPKNLEKKNTFSFSLTYMEALDTFIEQGNLSWEKKSQ